MSGGENAPHRREHSVNGEKKGRGFSAGTLGRERFRSEARLRSRHLRVRHELPAAGTAALPDPLPARRQRVPGRDRPAPPAERASRPAAGCGAVRF